MKRDKFVDLYLAGKVPASAIDDFVEEWHSIEEYSLEPNLGSYLGFTPKEYTDWIANPNLDEVLSDRNGPIV